MNTFTIGATIRGDQEIYPPYLHEAFLSTQRRASALLFIDIPPTHTENLNCISQRRI
jgi:hypothetical protein